MFPCYCDEKFYMVAMKCGNKRTSRYLYYRYIGYKGVEFVLDKEKAYICTKETAEFLANVYLRKRIGEVGFVLREF